MRYRWLMILGALALLGACGDDGNGTKTDGGGVTDKGVIPQNDAVPSNMTLKFGRQEVDTEPSGTHTRLAKGGGVIGLAYMRDPENIDTDCPASAGGTGSTEPRPHNGIFYSSYDASSDTWSAPAHATTTIAGTTYGLDLVIDGSGNPHIGFLGGELNVECTSADAMIATSTDGGQNWSEQTVGTAGIVGDTVGSWPSIALDQADAPHLIYRDQSEGFFAAAGDTNSSVFYDSEAASTALGWGIYNHLIFTADGEPSVLTSRSQNREGGGMAVMTRGSGGWTVADIATGLTSREPAYGHDGSGNYTVAYHNPGQDALFIREATDPTGPWSTPKRVDNSTAKTGRHAAIAYDANGNPAISYYRCSLASGGTCGGSEDGVVLAYRLGGNWEIFTVDTGGERDCGTNTSIVFDDNNLPIISYKCTFFDSIKGENVAITKVARGEWQPK